MAGTLDGLHKKRVARSAYILVFCALGLLQAFAQDNPKDLTEMPLEMLGKLEVYSASKFSQKASEAPASISIVTAADIEYFGYRTFDEILRGVTGFFVTYDRNYAYVGSRGFGLTGDYNSRILFLIDGHRLNDNIYGSSPIGTDFPIALDLIERIEIVRGPASSLYGTNAFFAVINVITKRGQAIDGVHLSAEARSQQTYQETGVFGRRYDNGLEVLFSGQYMDSKGNRHLYFPEFDSPGTNNGFTEDADTDRATNALANISYGGFEAQLVFKSRKKRFPTAAFDTVFNDKRSLTEDTVAYLDFSYNRKLQKNWELLARTFVNSYKSDGDYVYDYSTGENPDIVINRDIGVGKWWGGEANLTRNFAGGHHITAGTEWRYSFQAKQLNYDNSPYVLYMDSRAQTTDGAAYLQGEFAVSDNLLASAGVRLDHYGTFGNTTNPRFGIVYSPWKATTAKLLYGHAFRAPNLFELYYQDNISSKSNPELKPEKIRTLELVLERYIGSNFRVSGSTYQYWVNDQITQKIDPVDDLIFFENSDKIGAHGIEFELEAKDTCGIDGRLTYAVQRAKNLADMAVMPNSPQHIVQLRLFRWLFGMRIGAGLETRYMSSRKTLSGGHVGGFGLANFTLLYKKLVPGLDLSAGVYNIFDKRYSDPGGSEHRSDSLMQDGRSFRIRLGWGEEFGH
jgi:outer membrane receptor for ferrienterochelin and colicins